MELQITDFQFWRTYLTNKHDLQDDIGVQSHKIKIFLEVLMKQFITYTLLSWVGRNAYLVSKNLIQKYLFLYVDVFI